MTEWHENALLFGVGAIVALLYHIGTRLDKIYEILRYGSERE